jgi:UDPglucose--hexose-1-phosphate uridylyltransferase
MPRLRQNIITGDWVVIAPGRAKRPEDFILGKPKRIQTGGVCPFCKGGEGYLTAIPKDRTSNVYAMPNKFPAFAKKATEPPIKDHGFYDSYPALGGHEVIVITDHLRDIAHLYPSEINELLWVYQRRYLHYAKDPNIKYTMLIHNHGPEAGASIHHPHSQLFASCIVPSYVARELEGSKRFFSKNNKCVYCALAQQEISQKTRVLVETQNFSAFTFYAARFPFESWIVPKTHLPRFEEISEKDRAELAEVLKKLISMLDSKLNDPPYNYYIHTTPPRTKNFDRFYHWHLEVTPRLSKIGGYEMGSGVIIDVVSPETAASFLRNI